jgi:hypothetical protein
MLTHDTLHSKFYELRKHYYRYLSEEKMFYTLALANLIDWNLDYSDQPPSFAWMQVLPKPAITIAANAIDYMYDALEPVNSMSDYKKSELAFVVFTHELRHFTQYKENIFELYSLAPMLELLDSLRKRATTEEATKHWEKVIEEFQDPKSTRFKRYMARINNIALDTSLHEDVFTLFPNGEATVNELVKKWLKVESLEKDGKPFAGVVCTNSYDKMYPDPKNPYAVIKKNQHFVYYGDELIRREAKEAEQKQNPNDTKSFEQKIQEMLEKFEKEGKDITDGSGDSEEWEKIKPILEHLKEQAEQLGEKFKNNTAGRTSNDSPIAGDHNKALNDALKKALAKIKFIIRKIHDQHSMYENTFSKINKKVSSFPGSREMEHNKPKIQIVMVLDTSGSVFNDQIFTKMCTIAKFFWKREQLQALYCCDTELHPIDLSQFYTKTIKGLGGGGTELNNTHLAQIREDLKLKDTHKIDLVYVTDLEVDLNQLQHNKTINLHLVDIMNEAVKA